MVRTWHVDELEEEPRVLWRCGGATQLERSSLD